MLDHSYICIPRVRSLGTEFLDSWIFKFFFEFSLLEKCPNTELFLVRIFLYSDWIRRFTGKYGPEIIPYLDTFYAVFVKLKKKALWPLFLWMGFNCLKAIATLRRQFTFYHSVPRNSWYSFYRPQKDEKAETTLEPPSGFELGTSGLEMQRLNH